MEFRTIMQRRAISQLIAIPALLCAFPALVINESKRYKVHTEIIIGCTPRASDYTAHTNKSAVHCGFAVVVTTAMSKRQLWRCSRVLLQKITKIRDSQRRWIGQSHATERQIAETISLILPSAATEREIKLSDLRDCEI
ncbi:unnamed protein product [Lasius platythorax]|uniref:Secreted protein n=1 Tax=Lasius platythorax TaxID=488582 RepID=A0AAV2NJV1_9HYME